MSDPMLDCVVDVSHWQPPTQCDYHKAREAGILGVIVKVSQGMRGVDPAAKQHLTLARQAGLLVGCYHFLTGESGAAQAAHFLDCVDDALGLEGDATYAGILLALDWERNTGIGGQGQPTQARDFVSSVASQGAGLILYGNPIKALGYRDLDPAILVLDLWLPKYGNPPTSDAHPGWSEVKLWQHTDGSIGFRPNPVPGLGAVDRSIWFGDEDGLRAWWGAQSPPSSTGA